MDYSNKQKRVTATLKNQVSSQDLKQEENGMLGMPKLERHKKRLPQNMSHLLIAFAIEFLLFLLKTLLYQTKIEYSLFKYIF